MFKRMNLYCVIVIFAAGSLLMFRADVGLAQARRYRSELHAGGFTQIQIERDRALASENPRNPPMRFKARDQVGIWVSGYLTEDDRNGVEVHVQRFGFGSDHQHPSPQIQIEEQAD